MLTLETLDFKTKSKNWYIYDKTTTEDAKTDFATSQYGLRQIINELIHLFENFSSCIDPTFTLQLGSRSRSESIFTPKLSSSNCVCKINLKINFPPPYEREVWRYGQGNIKLTRSAVHEFS